ncbi:MAG: hypothetical protein PPHEESC_3884 [uncultured Paraburkholderia sp.]|nr:MAG: hypothetical protein PPHEESC_3884 [uncultured Paraburkholderia sp.]
MPPLPRFTAVSRAMPRSPRHLCCTLCQSAGPQLPIRQKPQEMVPDQAACDAMRRSFASAAPFMV